MNGEFQFLIEKEFMWAEMLMQVLKDNEIPCASEPVYGAGFTVRTGMQERLKIFVPAACMPQAEELLKELFSGEYTEK